MTGSKSGAAVNLLFGSIVAIISITLVASCAPPPAPLAIRLYNPETTQTLHCTARDQTGKYSEVLADSVEACAKQLEARGFVRE